MVQEGVRDQMRKRDLRERFLEKLGEGALGERIGCWEWKGYIDPQGYGRIEVRGQAFKAHRAAYELFIAPIPEGMHVLHHCDNRSCVNPAHLFLGTNSDNVADSVTKHRRARGESIGLAKLTQSQVREIRGQYKPFSRDVGGRALARHYGVNHSTIVRLIQGETWKA